MKLGKIIGISIGVLSGACIVTGISNGIREEKINKEFVEDYTKNYKSSIDSISIDSATAKKAYFKAAQNLKKLK